MKRTILLIAVLGMLALAGCNDLNKVKVTYIYNTDASNASLMPSVSITYRNSDGADHTATVKATDGFQYSMTVPLGTHIGFRATTLLPAKDNYSRLLTEVLVDDSAIDDKESDCTNGIQNADGTYELICDFQGEARGVPQ
jgi:hypothetical protein